MRVHNLKVGDLVRTYPHVDDRRLLGIVTELVSHLYVKVTWMTENQADTYNAKGTYTYTNLYRPGVD